MFIQTDTTPNPSTLKFLPGQAVMGEGTANFPTREDAARSPLASLFLPFIPSARATEGPYKSWPYA